jgi:sec-independent protein translocase protein TatC
MAEEDDPFQSTRMTLGEHIEELRRRLVRGVAAILVAACVTWIWYPEISHALLRPMRQALAKVDREQVEKYEALLREHPGEPRSKYFASDSPDERRLKPELTIGQRMAATGIGEGFGFAMRATLYAALAVGAPVLIWEMWQFIAAGLYARERKAVRKYFPISVLLFLAGGLFGFFVLLPWGFYFMASVYPPEDVQLLPSLERYMTLLTGMTLALGAVFQLPLVMYALVRLDLVQRATFARFRPHFVVAAFVVAGILTPPDPITQPLLALPMVGLYELGLLWARFVPKKPAPGAP